MDLSGLLDQLRAAAAYRSLVGDLKSRSPVQGSLRLLRSARAPLAAALAIDLQRPIVLMVPRPDRLMVLAEELPAWTPEARIYPFPDPNPLFYERAAWGPRTLRQRVVDLTALTAAAQPDARPKGGGTTSRSAPERD